MSPIKERRLDPLEQRPRATSVVDDGSLAESLSDDNQPPDLRPRSAKVAPQPTERRIRWQRGELVGKGESPGCTGSVEPRSAQLKYSHMGVEAVERDVSRLSEKERLQLVQELAPKLLQLLGTRSTM